MSAFAMTLRSSTVGVLCASLVLQPVLAANAPLPTGEQIRHGDINIQRGSTTMDVGQTSAYGIIDWNSFDVGAGHAVHFANGAGATLNRVTGFGASGIDGSLSATGSLYLLNPNGVIIGADGSVLTGGDFIGSTLNITDADFLNGGGFTLVGDAAADFVNLGRITSSGGDVILAGYTVSNSGEISAPEGRVGLAAGTEIDVLTDVSWANGAFAVKLGERGTDVTNEGRIEAMVAELRSHGGNIYALAGNNEGLIHAAGVRNEGGKVFLVAEQGAVESSGVVRAERGDNGGDIEIAASLVRNYGGVQDVSGATGGSIEIDAGTLISDTEMLAIGIRGDGGDISIRASEEVLLTGAGVMRADGAEDGGRIGIDAGAGKLILSGALYANGQMRGGRIGLTGNNVSLLGGSVSANGGPMGGEILIGGGWQGAPTWDDWARMAGADNAARTYVSETSLLSADAGQLGMGGTVVVWADGTTQFAGSITARGGILGGDGGRVETSGLEGLGVSGFVDASARAAYGRDGAWLLDPKNIIIDDISDPVSEFQRLVGFGGALPDAQNNQRFGSSLAIDGDTLVVGTSGDLANNRVYVFENGAIAAFLSPGGRAAATKFGRAVAVLGNHVAVSDSDAQGGGLHGGHVSVYFKGNGWQNGTANLAQYIANPSFTSSQPDSDFGVNLALRPSPFFFGADQVDVLVADPLLDVNIGNAGFDGTDYGGFHAFGFNAATGGQFASGFFPDGIFGDFSGLFRPKYGTHMAASEGIVYVGGQFTGPLAVISPATNTAAVPWSPGALAADGARLLSVSGGGGSVRALTLREFDFSVNDRAAVSSQVDFNVNIGTSFGSGTRVALSDDLILVGESRVGGFAYVEPAGGWGACPASGCLSAFQDLLANGNFLGGDPLPVAADDDLAAIGVGFEINAVTLASESEGRVRLLQRNGATWASGFSTSGLKAQVPDTSHTFGKVVAVDGDTVVVSDHVFASPVNGESSGAVFVFEGETLSAVLEPNNRAAFFGNALDIDGSTIAVLNAESNGALFLFERGAGWLNGQQNLSASLAQGVLFNDVSLSGSALALTVRPGAVRDVNIYERAGALWSNADFGAPSATFSGVGDMVDLDGDTFVSWFAPGNFATFGGPVTVVENMLNNWSTATATSLNRGAFAGIPATEFGGAAAVSGNLIAVGSGSTGDNAVYVYERSSDWASAAAPVARLTATLPVSDVGFGRALAVDGDLIAVPFKGRDLYIYDRQSGWRNDDANLIATLTQDDAQPFASGFNDLVALSGNTLAIARSAGDQTRAAFRFNGPFDLNTRGSFLAGPGDTLNIAATSLANSLSLGTDITLQANNDISVRSPITVNNPFGDGGNLSLNAGRSILVTAPITTDNGDLTLIANSAGADLAFRDAGEGVVVLGTDAANAGITLNLGTGNLLINGGDRFENRTGLTDPFRFDAGAPGRWVVYSGSPDPTGAPDLANLGLDVAIVGRDFLQYGVDFDANDPLPTTLPMGNGFVYSVQPTVGVNVGDATIAYGATATPALTLGAITVNGQAATVPSQFPGVTVAQMFGIGAADLPNLVDTGLAGSVGLSTGGFANAGTFVGGLTATAKPVVTAGSVFGLNVATGGAGTLTVTPATLTVAGLDFDRVYDATADASLAGANLVGTLAGDLLTVDFNSVSASFANEFVGVGKTVTINGAPGLAGADAGNYLLDFPATATGTISALDLNVTGLVGVDRIYDATTDALFAGTAAIAPLALDAGRVGLGGNLTATASFADKNVGTDKALTVSGFVLTGSHAVNYNLIQPQGLTADITPASLLLQGLTGIDRVYDSTTNVGIAGMASVTALASDLVAVNGWALGSFDDKNVGADKGVTVAGLTLAGIDAGNYTLATSAATSGITASVTPADLLVSGLAANDRVYDATLAATLSGTAAVTPLGADLVTLDAGAVAGAFADKNVGTAKAVTVSGLSISGVDAQNYTLIAPQGLTANITPADLQLNGVTANDRVYDATDVATLSGLATVTPLAMDLVTVAGTPDARFDDKNVGVGKAVTVTGYTLAGTDAGNYTLLQPTGLSAEVIARPLTVAGFTVDDRVYDATTNATGTGTAQFGGILTGDAVVLDASAFSIAFADKNAGTDKAVAISGLQLTGADAGNYDTNAAGLTATITAAQLDINGVTAADRVYDATTVVSLSGGALGGLFAGDDVTLSTAGALGNLADKNVGANRAVTASGYTVSGGDAGNYALVQPQGLTASISQAALNLVGLNGDKTYDGTVIAPLTVTGLDAVFAGDVVSADLSAFSGSYADKNAGANRDITLAGVAALLGADAGNYSLNQPAALTGTIAQRGITVVGLTIADKIYDGTVIGAISGTGTFGGAIAGDDLSINVGAVDISFATATAGVDKAVALSGVTLAGADAGNYTAATPTGLTGTILQRQVTVSGLSAEDKVYDRTAVATIAGLGSLNNLVMGDLVSLDETQRAGAFDDENVATDKAVTVSGLALTGSDALNYLLLSPAGITANVTPATVDLVGVTGVNRIYDATTAAPLSGTAALDFGVLTGVLEAQEDIGFGGTLTGAFADKNVADGKAITLAGVQLTGGDAGNYTLRLPTNLSADVTPLSVQVAGVAADDRVYDATRLASLSGTPLVGILAADDATLGGTVVANFDDKNVGADKAVTVAGYALSGVDAFNYTLLQPSGLTADISVADLALTGIAADDRVYDGTLLAPLSGALAIAPLGMDTVTLDGRVASVFADRNVGVDKAVQLSGLNLAGIDAANYRLILPTLTADVTARALTVAGLSGVDRIYDATTVASIAGTGVLDDVVPGDTVGFALNALTANFANKNAGQGKPITLAGDPLTGADATNYSLALPTTLTANIAPKPVSVLNAAAVDRQYDGTVDVAIDGGEADGLIAGDAATLVTEAAAGTVPDRDVGADQPVTVTGFDLAGVDAANYALAQPQGLTVDLSPRVVSIVGVEVSDKFFDGTEAATISGGRLDDVIPGDNVNLDAQNGSGVFDDPEVGNAKPVLLAGFSISGADAANYALVETPTATGDILRAPSLVTDIIPPEALRATTEAVIAQQRAALTEFANRQADAVALIDYEALDAALLAGPATSANASAAAFYLSLPRDQLAGPDGVLADAAARVEQDKAAFQQASQVLRAQSRQARVLAQDVNRNARELSVATGLETTIVAEIEAAAAQLELADANLAQIADAKRRIPELLDELAEAERLGRGAAVAELQEMIAQLEGLVAEESAVRAQRDGLAAVVTESQQRLDANRAQVAALEAEGALLAEQSAQANASVENAREATESANASLAASSAELDVAAETARAQAADDLARFESRIGELDQDIAAARALAASETGAAADRFAALETADLETIIEELPPELSAQLTDLMAQHEAEFAAMAAEGDVEREAVATLGRVRSDPASVDPAVGSDFRGSDARALLEGLAPQLEGMTPEQIANLSADDLTIDPSLLAIDTITELADRSAAVESVAGTLGDLLGQAPTLATGNLVSDPLDPTAATRFDTGTEMMLGAMLRSEGLLPSFESPAIAALPVAQQVVLHENLQRVKEIMASAPVGPDGEPQLTPEDQAILDIALGVFGPDVTGLGVESAVIGNVVGELAVKYGISAGPLIDSVYGGPVDTAEYLVELDTEVRTAVRDEALNRASAFVANPPGAVVELASDAGGLVLDVGATVGEAALEGLANWARPPDEQMTTEEFQAQQAAIEARSDTIMEMRDDLLKTEQLRVAAGAKVEARRELAVEAAKLAALEDAFGEDTNQAEIFARSQETGAERRALVSSLIQQASEQAAQEAASGGASGQLAQLLEQRATLETYRDQTTQKLEVLGDAE